LSFTPLICLAGRQREHGCGAVLWVYAQSAWLERGRPHTSRRL